MQNLCTGVLYARGALLWLLVFSQAALANESGPEVITASTVLNLVLSLGFVLLLIVGLGWYVRRMQGFSAGAHGAVLQVLATTAVGAKERVVLLRVGQEKVLLGVAAGSVQMLGRYDVATGVSPPDSPLAQAADDEQSFANALSRVENRVDGKVESKAERQARGATKNTHAN